MILLLGGTSDCPSVAEALARAGYHVLVSSATEVDLFTGSHPRIERRCGRLDAGQMAALIGERNIRAIVDAAHPYATLLHATAEAVACKVGIPYLSYVRPGSVGAGEGVCVVADHEAAAQRAFQAGKSVLLTIGSRYVVPYAEEARRKSVDLIARVLDHPDSLQACRDAGIPHIVTGRGPFSVDENRRLIRQFSAGVLVTKDSGDAGGVREKLEAARLEGCEVIVVGRPERSGGFDEVPALVTALKTLVAPSSVTVLALDLESVLVPEIWETVARVACVPELLLTTRDVADYGELMGQRLALCREHGLTLARLREIVEAMEPLPGAVEFLAWARQHAQIAILSDTFHELAGPLLPKLGSPLLICHHLNVDADGFVSGYDLRDETGKAGAIARFQHAGARVAAVGDSFNDLEMLRAADCAFLFRPSTRVLEAGVAFPAFRQFDELQDALSTFLL
jgi:bifunctional phosphoserine phosphatase/homoserine phosphotransferase/precorrin-6x reductase